MLFAARLFRQEPAGSDLWSPGQIFYIFKEVKNHSTIVEMEIEKEIKNNLSYYLKEGTKVQVWIPDVKKEFIVSIDGEKVPL